MNKNSVGILLLVLGIGLAAGGYFGVYNNFNEKKDALAAQNATLQSEVDQLQDLADHKQEYLDETARMNAENDEVIAQFPAEVRPEDEIMYVVATEEKHGAVSRSISMPGTSVIEVARPAAETVSVDSDGSEPAPAEGEDGEVVEDTAAMEEAAPQIMLYQTPVNISLQVAYENLKDLVRDLTADRNDKKAIQSLTMAFDESTGGLTGAMSYSMYSLSGTSKTYQSPEIPGVAFGTDNIFNSVARAAAAKKEAQAAANAAKSESAGE